RRRHTRFSRDWSSDVCSSDLRLVGVVHVSNALGTVNPIGEIIALAKQAGAKVLIDGAQAVAHTPVDVQDLGCDFYVFSGHKLYEIGRASWRERVEVRPG